MHDFEQGCVTERLQRAGLDVAAYEALKFSAGHKKHYYIAFRNTATTHLSPEARTPFRRNKKYSFSLHFQFL